VVTSVAFSPDGKLLVTGTSTGRIYGWDVANPAIPVEAWTAAGNSGASVTSVAFSPDGELFVAGDSHGNVILRIAASGTVLTSRATGAPVNGVAFSPDGNAIAAGNSAGTIDLLDGQGNLITTYSDGGSSVTSVAFHIRNGTTTLAAADSAGEIQLFTSPNKPQAATAVALAASASSAPEADKVRQFAVKYFTAINHHNYNQFIALLNAQQQTENSRSAFESGYASVTDYGAIITGITAGPARQVVANLTFASLQNPADSVDNSACDQWNISFYLVQQGNGYVMTAAPADYHASFTDC
jgi:WD40 repeat protein